MNTNHSGADGLLSTVDVAEIVDRHPATVAQWRCNRVGPPYVRVGRHVRYRREDVEQWARAHGVALVVAEDAA